MTRFTRVYGDNKTCQSYLPLSSRCGNDPLCGEFLGTGQTWCWSPIRLHCSLQLSGRWEWPQLWMEFFVPFRRSWKNSLWGSIRILLCWEPLGGNDGIVVYDHGRIRVKPSRKSLFIKLRLPLLCDYAKWRMVGSWFFAELAAET